jgi:hypothetical protein
MRPVLEGQMHYVYKLLGFSLAEKSVSDCEPVIEHTELK